MTSNPNPSPSLRVLAEQARDAKRDRATSVTGGMDCMECGRVFFGAEDMLYCGVCHAEKAFRAATPSTTVIALLDEIDALRKALSASVGYLMNAKIDLETGATKATAIRTIEGGIRIARAALNGEKT